METMNRSAPTYQSIYSDGKKKKKKKQKVMVYLIKISEGSA